MKFITLFDILFAMYLRWKIFISVLSIFVITTILYILLTKPIYAPTAIVKANIYENVPTWVADLLQQRLIPTTPVDRMASQIELIKVLAPSALKENGANLKFNFPKKFVKISERKTIIDTIRKNLKFEVILYPESILVFKDKNLICSGKFSDTINCNYFSFSLEKIKEFKNPIKGSIIYYDFSKTIDNWIKNRISISQIGISDLVRISVESDDPEYAVLIANKIAQKYIDYSLEEERELARRTRERLEVFYKEAERRVDSLKKIIQALKIDTISLVSYILDFGLGNEPMARIVERYFNNPGDKILEKVAKGYVTKSLTLEEIYSAYNILVSQRNSLASIIENTKLVEAKSVSVAKIIDYASIPPKPKWPKKSLLLLLSLFFGSIFGIFIVLIWDRFDNKIYTPLKLKTILNNNIPIFYNIEDMKTFLLSNNLEKIYSTEKLDELENSDLQNAQIFIACIKRGISKNELFSILKKGGNKQKIVYFKL
ncbi:MAG: GNVR domain-containing protein [candidate division WOR-3 bacterium]